MQYSFNIQSIMMERYNNAGLPDEDDRLEYAGIKNNVISFIGFLNLTVNRVNLLDLKVPFKFQIDINLKSSFSPIQVLDMVTDIINMYNQKGKIYETISDIADTIYRKSIFQLEVDDDEDSPEAG